MDVSDSEVNDDELNTRMKTYLFVLELYQGVVILGDLIGLVDGFGEELR